MPDVDITKVTSVSTDPYRYIPADMQEWLRPQAPRPPDPVSKYGAPMQDDQGRWVRHFVDVPNGKTHSLCGLPLDGVDKQASVDITCVPCAERHRELRGR